MNHGFVRVAAATPSIRVADVEHNVKEVISAAREAIQQDVSILTLPELCLTGYTCLDLFLQKTLLDAAMNALLEFAEATSDSALLSIVGLPVAGEDDRLYNCAAVVHRGKVLALLPKINLPNYGEFQEMRYFTPAPEETRSFSLPNGETCPFGRKLLFCCKEIPSLRVAVEICEDLWTPQPPSGRYAMQGATVICNPSASDETIGKAEYRRMLVAGQSARTISAYIYADAGEGESTTDLIYSGHNLIAENGVLLAEQRPFSGKMLTAEIDVEKLSGERRRMNTFVRESENCMDKIQFSVGEVRTLSLSRRVQPHPFVPSSTEEREARCEAILNMQAQGLKKRLQHTHAASAVLGLSGGLDSTLALLVTSRAFDLIGKSRKEIVAVTMPGFGTTGRTYQNAVELAHEIGATLKEISIAQAATLHLNAIGHDMTPDVTYENAQARERTQILMDVANMTGGLVIGTGDLSELALGWATYNGDHMSMYGVNASVPKTLVRYLVRYYADHCSGEKLRALLLDILDTPVSPELLPPQDGDIAQKTEELVGPYELHDFFLYHIVRSAEAPAKVYRLAKLAFSGQYEDAVILKWLKNFYRRFFAQQFKRSCLPDGPKVGSVTLSPRGDWRMPSDAVASLWMKEAEALE